MKIIALSGKKQSGKTTAVNGITEHLSGWDEFSFAGFLKSMVLNLFCPVGWKLPDIETKKGFLLPTGRTVREQLQWLGTDVLRKEYADCLINTFKSIYEQIRDDFDSADHLLISDVRFPNEVKAIQDLGGHVIRLLRNPHNDQHESETALDEMDKSFVYRPMQERDGNRFDAFVDNRGMSIETQNEVIWKLVNERKWI